MEEWTGRTSFAADRPAQMRQASAAYSARRRQDGWRRIAVWVPENRADELRAIVALMCEKTDDGGYVWPPVKE